MALILINEDGRIGGSVIMFEYVMNGRLLETIFADSMDWLQPIPFHPLNRFVKSSRITHKPCV